MFKCLILLCFILLFTPLRGVADGKRGGLFFSFGGAGEYSKFVLPDSLGRRGLTYNGFGARGEFRGSLKAGKIDFLDLELFGVGGQWKGSSGSEKAVRTYYGAGIDVVLKVFFLGFESLSNLTEVYSAGNNNIFNYFSYSGRLGFRIPVSANAVATFIRLGVRAGTGQSLLTSSNGATETLDHRSAELFLGINLGFADLF